MRFKVIKKYQTLFQRNLQSKQLNNLENRLNKFKQQFQLKMKNNNKIYKFIKLVPWHYNKMEMMKIE